MTMIGGSFCYSRGSVAAEAKVYPPEDHFELATWDNIKTDVKFITGGIEKETKEFALNPEKLSEIHIYMAPGDVLRCAFVGMDGKTLGTGWVKKFGLQLGEPLCASNTWKKWEEKKTTEKE